MIREYVIRTEELPEVSAFPFAHWLNESWFDFVDDPEANRTNGQVISGALAAWRGQA